MTFKLFTDGGSRGNPGPGGIAAILFKSDWLLLDFENKYIPLTTNNQAEYSALIMGLKLAAKNKVSDLTCYLDSELVVKQLNGEYKIKDESMKRLKAEIDTESAKFSSIVYKHVLREKNKFADKLVNLVLDNVTKQS